MLSLIVATDRNRLIGNNNQLPWHLPKDLQHFKKTTLGKPILMGRKTWDSIGRPLPGRRNIVLTRQADWQAEGAEVVQSLDAAMAQCQDVDELMVIGGANVYEQAMPLADRIYLTRVDAEFEGDAWFPELGDEWVQISEEAHTADEKNPWPHQFVCLERQK